MTIVIAGIEGLLDQGGSEPYLRKEAASLIQQIVADVNTEVTVINAAVAALDTTELEDLSVRVGALELAEPPVDTSLTAQEVIDLISTHQAGGGVITNVDLASGNVSVSAATYAAADTLNGINATVTGRLMTLAAETAGFVVVANDKPTSTKLFKLVKGTKQVNIPKGATGAFWVSASEPNRLDVLALTVDTYVGLADAPSTITANALQGGNAAGTALENKTAAQVRTAAGMAPTAADKLWYGSGVNAVTEIALTAAGRALIDDAAASNQRTTLGLVIGTDVQAYDADLTALGTAPMALSDAATIATDALSNRVFTVTLGGNRTLDLPTNLSSGQSYTWIITQDGTGGRTLAYHADFLFPSGIAPILSTAAAAVNVLVATYDGSKLRAYLMPVAQGEAVVALADGANIATNAALGRLFRVVLGGNRTLDNPTNLSAFGAYKWIIRQDGTGTRTLAYGSKFKFPGGAPTLSIAASAVDVIAGIYDPTSDVLLCDIAKAFT